jgi:uncharacterized secreted protein with C-terminal beta-propeller domain
MAEKREANEKSIRAFFDTNYAYIFGIATCNAEKEREE